jgi:glutamate 5-kinase
MRAVRRSPELDGAAAAALTPSALVRETSAGGSGGMASKLEAARLAAAEGVPVVIAAGSERDVLARIVRGENVGTLVRAAHRGARTRRIAVSAERRGALVVNDGALAALVARKASLLPIGVVAVEGEFEKGDVVEIRDGSGRVHGRGLVNYRAAACRALAGRKSEDMDALLAPAERGYDALVTRDNLVMGNL